MTRILAVVLTLIVALTTALVASPPARADAPIGVSRDGQEFSAALTRPLFDPRERWVPGDVRSARLWIRNDSVDPADLAVRLVARDGFPALLEQGGFSLTADADGRRRQARRDGDTVARVRLEPGEVAGVAFVARFDPTSGNRTQEVSGSFDLALQLSQVGAAGVETAPDDGPGGGSGADDGSESEDGAGPGQGLAGTGGTAMGWLVAAAIAIGTGIRLVRNGREQ